jgi:hypothetical protein
MSPTSHGSGKRKSAYLENRAKKKDTREARAERAIDAIRRGSRIPVEGIIEWHQPDDPDKKARADGERARLSIAFEDGTEHEYELAIMSSGGANYALSTSAQDIMIRLAKYPVRPKKNDLCDHVDEVKVTRELADLGICPAIFLDIRIREKGRWDVYPATAIERMHYSLSAVQKCPVLMRKMFVEADGESALVDLYTRASQVVRCTDTKPANVVVNLYDDGTPPRIALIDVDTVHCWRLESPRYYTPTDESDAAPIEALSSYLSGVDLTDDTIPLTPMLTLTLSLLVHVTVAAGDYKAYREEFGFPYPRITRVLIGHWGIVHELVWKDHEAAEAANRKRKGESENQKQKQKQKPRYKDARYGVLPRLGDRTVLEEIVHYCGEEEPDPKNRVCTWSNLHVFLESMLELPASEVLEVCRMNDEPSLYESLVTMLSARTLTESVYRKKMSKVGEPDKTGKVDKRRASAERMRSLRSLAMFAPRSGADYTVPVRCNLRTCKYHGADATTAS